MAGLRHKVGQLRKQKLNALREYSMGRIVSLAIAATALLGSLTFASAEATKKPHIIVIWGDDIGQSNVSAFTNGLMGYRTPNIDSFAKEGVIFTDYYGEQSCTAGRASFIGANRDADGHDKSRHAGRKPRTAKGRSDQARRLQIVRATRTCGLLQKTRGESPRR
jgi:hypothetical protein